MIPREYRTDQAVLLSVVAVALSFGVLVWEVLR